jgi:hypothetical protein
MHLPERWGILQFADGAVNKTAAIPYPDWAAREVAMALYYAEKAYSEQHNGTYTEDLSALQVCVIAPPIQYRSILTIWYCSVRRIHRIRSIRRIRIRQGD